MPARAFYRFFICLLLALGWTAGACEASQKATLLLEHAQSAPWIELLKEGLEKGGRDFDFETAVVIAPDDGNQTEAFRKAASESDLVLVATDNFHEILRDNAANFRRVKFGCLDAGIRAPNIMSVTFADEQASFLAGMAAAMLAGQIAQAGANAKAAAGWLSGGDTPATRSLANGFIEGAKLGDPGGRTAQAVTNSFVDESLAAQKARWLLDAGARVIALAAGAGNRAALAVLEKNKAWRVDLDAFLSERGALGLISKKTDKAVYEIMKSAASPQFAGKEILIYDLADGGVDFQLSPAILKDPSKSGIARRVKELKSEIIKGAVRIPSLRARTLCDCLD